MAKIFHFQVLESHDGQVAIRPQLLNLGHHPIHVTTKLPQLVGGGPDILRPHRLHPRNARRCRVFHQVRLAGVLQVLTRRHNRAG